MAGYSRQESYTDGGVIEAAHTNNEFNQLAAAFNAASGHAHDGSPDNGAFIPLIKDKDTLTSVRANGAVVEMDVNGFNALFTFSKGTSNTPLINGIDISDLASLSHTHPISDIINLQSTLDSKYSDANKPHWDDVLGKPDVALNGGSIEIANVTGLSTELASKYSDTNKPQWTDILNTPNFALVGHNHAISEIVGLSGSLSSKFSTSNKPTWNDVTGKPNFDATYAQLGHSHVISDVTGLQSSLNSKYSPTNQPHWDDIQGKPDINGGGGGTVGDIEISDVTGLQSSLDSKFSTTNQPAINQVVGLEVSLNSKYSSTNQPLISNVTGLQSSLDTKYSSSNKPGINDVTGLQAALDSKFSTIHRPDWDEVSGKPDFDATYAPLNHNHSISEITGLQAQLNTIPDKVHVSVQFSSATVVPTPCDHYILSGLVFSGTVDIGTGWPLGAVIDLYMYNSSGATATITTQGNMFGPLTGSDLSAANSHTITGEALIRLVNADNSWRLSVIPIGTR